MYSLNVDLFLASWSGIDSHFTNEAVDVKRKNCENRYCMSLKQANDFVFVLFFAIFDKKNKQRVLTMFGKWL